MKRVFSFKLLSGLLYIESKGCNPAIFRVEVIDKDIIMRRVLNAKNVTIKSVKSHNKTKAINNSTLPSPQAPRREILQNISSAKFQVLSKDNETIHEPQKLSSHMTSTPKSNSQQANRLNKIRQTRIMEKNNVTSDDSLLMPPPPQVPGFNKSSFCTTPTRSPAVLSTISRTPPRSAAISPSISCTESNKTPPKLPVPDHSLMMSPYKPIFQPSSDVWRNCQTPVRTYSRRVNCGLAPVKPESVFKQEHNISFSYPSSTQGLLLLTDKIPEKDPRPRMLKIDAETELKSIQIRSQIRETSDLMRNNDKVPATKIGYNKSRYDACDLFKSWAREQRCFSRKFENMFKRNCRQKHTRTDYRFKFNDLITEPLK